MKKDKRNAFIFVVIIIISVILSIIIYQTGILSKLRANANSVDTISSYPVINGVMNSSGEFPVNTDIVISIDASSAFNINAVEYSFDMKKWYRKTLQPKKHINYKFIFNEDINKIINIRVINEKGLASYVYKTKMYIDKTSPSVIIKDDYIYLKDNNIISKIQYSNDGINWTDYGLDKMQYKIKKEKYKYVRAVDETGNISSTNIINN